MAVRRSASTFQRVHWVQPDCPRLKGNLQGSKAKALIVQSPVAFFVVVTQSSECGLLYKEKKNPSITGVLMVLESYILICSYVGWHEVCPFNCEDPSISEAAFIQLSLGWLLP